MLTRAQICKELADIFTQLLPEIPPTHIRRAYQKGGMPAFKEDGNYLYYWLSTFDSDFQKPTERSFDGKKEQLKYSATKGLQVNITIYGDNAQELVFKLEQLSKNPLFFKNLRLNGIFLICHHETPTVTQEPVNSQWFLRADLKLRFYEKVEFSTPMGAIESANVKLFGDESVGDNETGFITEIGE